MPKPREPREDPYGTAELFPASLGRPDEDASEKPKRKIRSLAMGKCPECQAKVIGLIRQGDHYVWRNHLYRTWGNAPMPCRASGVAVCIAPELQPFGARPIHCPHEES